MSTIKKLCCYVAVMVCLTMTTLNLWAAGYFSSSAKIKDFGIFYQAGLYLKDNQSTRLYPSLTATVNDDLTDYTKKDKLYHYFDDRILCWYLYPPLLALFFEPLSNFPIKTAVLIWIWCNVFTLFASCALVAKTTDKPPSLFKLFMLSFTMIAVAHCLIAQQSSIVCGLFPVSLGYYFWQKNQPIKAGVSWSFLVLKPTLLFFALPIVGAHLFIFLAHKTSQRTSLSSSTSQSFKLCIAFAASLSALLVISLLIFGPLVCLEWLHSLALKNTLLFGTQVFYDSPWHLASFESLVALSKSLRPLNEFVKPVMYLFAAATLIFQSLLARKVILSEMPDSLKKEALLFNGVAFLPLNSIYLHNYDLVIYLPLYWIMLANKQLPRFDKMLPTFFLLLAILIMHFWSLTDIDSGQYQIWQAIALVLLVYFAALTQVTYLLCADDQS